MPVYAAVTVTFVSPTSTFSTVFCACAKDANARIHGKRRYATPNGKRWVEFMGLLFSAAIELVAYCRDEILICRMMLRQNRDVNRGIQGAKRRVTIQNCGVK